MKYDYDLICIGLGPAGMAVSIMGAAMGLKVCGIEKHRIGGECMNVGCIPSKALLQIARHRHLVSRFEKMGLSPQSPPEPLDPFRRIQEHLRFISDNKTRSLFDKVHLVLGEGAAEFVDPHTIRAGTKTYTARRIFIATGTRPMILPVPGIETVPYLTNETIFSLDAVPESLIVHGGGAIACEMAQAFARLGSRVALVQRSEHILSRMDPDAARLIEDVFREEGIVLHTGRLAVEVESRGGQIQMRLDNGETVQATHLLEAAGRAHDYREMKLENAGIAVDQRGAIPVDRHLRTAQKHIYGIGDCNGHYLFSHAAMHQGMIALMNSMLPRPLKRRFDRYVVPYTMFTDPPVSGAGYTEDELRRKKIPFETVETRYGDYGAAIAEEIPTGYVRAFIGRTGKILGASIVGEGSGEMINEWALALQKRMRITDIMMLQHSFPTMGFLSKRVAEVWMMKKMKSHVLQAMCRRLFRL
jgi:pyruvate/2-oxoglutarate dehydrogenase complex dihydrolipoamide dehydrogenase (E3) component